MTKPNFCVALHGMNSLLLHRISKEKQYLYSVLTVVSVAAFCFLLSNYIGYRVVALVLLFTVSLLAIIFDILPVLISAALSAFVWGYFFIPPRFTIQVETTEDSILLSMYFVIAMINAALSYKIRQVEKLARIKEERANSVKLYNTILDSLSHELRTPLAAIIAATDNLRYNENLTQNNRQQLIDEIAKASLRLNQQVENLLNISRLESGHIQPKQDWCDIIELVHEVVKSVEDNQPARKIDISINPGMPLCKTDKGILQQVLYNLLNNAAVHTKPDSIIEIAAANHADILEFVIEDSGEGFQTINPKTVFDKLARSKNAKTGRSGLGLSIVSGFTEALGGQIALNRSKLGGAKFTVLLPVKTSHLTAENE